MSYFRVTRETGEVVREPIAREEAEAILAARKKGVEVQEQLTWADLHLRWLYRERGSWASWEGPQCSYGYFSTYVYPEAGWPGEAVPGRYRTITYLPAAQEAAR